MWRNSTRSTLNSYPHTLCMSCGQPSIGSRSRGQLCRSPTPAKIVISWGTWRGPGILVGPVTTPDTSDDKRGSVQLARELLGPTWPRVRRIPLIRREIRESLSDSALEILFSTAELLTEGSRDLDVERPLRQERRGYATVMVTLDLGRSAALLRERADEATALRVAELMRGSAAVRRRVIELARPRLAELFDAEPRHLRVELLPVVRVSGSRILIDGDAVVSLRSEKARARVGGRSKA